MAKRRSTPVKSPLEWVTLTLDSPNAAPVNGRIALRLDRDEVAEIKKVVISVGIPWIDDAADDDVTCSYMVSLDPDVIASPAVLANREDLEVFMIGEYDECMRVGAAGQTVMNGQWRDELNLPEGSPVLAGSDIGIVVAGDAALPVRWTVTVYLVRRRARPGEKFNVLLSRR